MGKRSLNDEDLIVASEANRQWFSAVKRSANDNAADDDDVIVASADHPIGFSPSAFSSSSDDDGIA